MRTLQLKQGQVVTIQRNHVFEDVIPLYRTKPTQVLSQEFEVKFSDECALDAGGVTRELFSAFWEVAKITLFDGCNVVIPSVNPHSELIHFSVIGTVLSHGYLISGYIPIAVAFPVLVCALKGPTVEIPVQIMIEAFLNYLSDYEANILKQALSTSGSEISGQMQTDLVDILSKFGCRQVPKRANIRTLVLQVATHEMQTVPSRVLHYMHSGVPLQHKPFWESLTVNDLLSLYNFASVSPFQIIHAVKVPEDMTPIQSRAFNFLISFIGNLKDHTVKMSGPI